MLLPQSAGFSKFLHLSAGLSATRRRETDTAHDGTETQYIATSGQDKKSSDIKMAAFMEQRKKNAFYIVEFAK